MTRLGRLSPPSAQAAAALGKPVLAPVSAAPHGAPGAYLSEAQLHTACAQYLDAVLASEVIWTSIGHGGGGKIRGALLKRMGVKRGVPDIYLAWQEGGRSHTAWLELKSAKGKPSEDQQDFASRALDLGHGWAICRSLDQLAHFLEDWRVPVRLTRAKVGK